MTKIKPSPREELILEVLKVAADRISVKDFDIQCQLAPVSTGKSYYDRIRIAEKLIQEGLIEKADDRLRIVSKIKVPDWLRDSLLEGSEISWNILDVIDSGGKIEGKLDLELLAQIGVDGEKFVIDQLKQLLSLELQKQIKHISLTDDTAGFDIVSPSTIDVDKFNLLEVKTSSRPGENFRFFISRNEARIASKNENWKLVAVLKQSNGLKILGYLNYSHFVDILPQNLNRYCRWESASIVVPTKLILPGLP